MNIIRSMVAACAIIFLPTLLYAQDANDMDKKHEEIAAFLNALSPSEFITALKKNPKLMRLSLELAGQHCTGISSMDEVISLKDTKYVFFVDCWDEYTVIIDDAGYTVLQRDLSGTINDLQEQLSEGSGKKEGQAGLDYKRPEQVVDAVNEAIK